MEKEDRTERRRVNLAGQAPRARVVTPEGECYTLKFMEWNQIPMVDEALNSLGEYGEVRLIVEKGRLRFLVTQKSFDALKWQPGNPIE